MGSTEFINWCKETIVDYFNSHRDKTDSMPLSLDDVYVVWLSKTLQNNKGLFSTTVSDGMYYECTYNGDKQEMYLDAYKKWENVVVPLVNRPYCFRAMASSMIGCDIDDGK